MNSRFIDNWIRTLLAERPLRANSLIITVYGDSIAPHGGTVWLGSFIRLVELLGLNPRMVRTAVFRLTRDGWFSARPIGRRSYYSLTSAGRRRFEHAFRRIYQAPPRDWNGDWQIVLTSCGELAAEERNALRKDLLWEGFGTIAPGVLAHPSADLASLTDILQANGVAERVVAFRARSLAEIAARPLQALVHECWNLEGIAAHYADFIERFRPVQRSLARPAALDPQQCFVVQTLLLHEFRRVLLRDPQLPAQLLPRDWPGIEARALCRELYLVTHRPVERHLAAVLETPEGPLPQAAPYFYERFGGLDTRATAGQAATAVLAQ
ncbi:MAG TPA: phenylacetic acid degradation operon negative regulatory protein PaaX [Rhodocyclaceae bacterium]|nr:MAG: phenylacetic acid degradation operon negative regulatory protein PaaX [Betaproteobacteria bacterium CG2_30_68_42]PIX74157.1 MAG: phenylacetic acid degradation operon negative regulatory protein PaaX [Rhodocyclales bacterium CG_4_10_14_3_um_filter_68_10]PJA56400.1 MAG: phenylacetic acid degradation operon negative regulatory protein PaaX [Rhodocyclales bacterium CG_4_9_14_3_um_filter_68_10]HCX33134.1 phenylacetic acid degradation operon negative regulatory protein PaaX [Rhodocyclaceae bac